MIQLVNAFQSVQQLLLIMVIIIFIDVLCNVQDNTINLLVIITEVVYHSVLQEFILQLTLLICMVIIQLGHVFHYAHKAKIFIILNIQQIRTYVNVF